MTFRPRRSWLFLLLLGVLAPNCPALDAAALRQQVLERQRQTRSWSADFTQTLVMPGMRQPVVSAGSAAYLAPDLLRLDFRQPAGEFVLIVADHLYLQKAGAAAEVKALTGDGGGRPFQALLGFLRGQPAADDGAFDAAVTSEGDDYWFTLTRSPEAAAPSPRLIRNRIARTTLDIREIFVELPNGGTLTYRFDRVTRNQPIAAERFRPPQLR
jgi:outer membrane lipoprotein-sorting protein